MVFDFLPLGRFRFAALLSLLGGLEETFLRRLSLPPSGAGLESLVTFFSGPVFTGPPVTGSFGVSTEPV